MELNLTTQLESKLLNEEYYCIILWKRKEVLFVKAGSDEMLFSK